jgi:hypothetical protein
MVASRGSIYVEATNYTAPGCKFIWKKISEKVYMWESKGEWIDVTVRFCDYPMDRIKALGDRYATTAASAQKWEIQVNNIFISRDKMVFFNDLDTALKAVELKVIPAIIRNLQEEI